jgi:16S rRNA (cytosine1402-N4)-methyltransferase
MVDKNHISNQSTQKPEGQSSPIYHLPVLLAESIGGLNIKKDGVYVDCTYGGGGHSVEILKRLNEAGRIYVFDQDREVLKNLPDDPRITFLPHNFRHLKRFLRLNKILLVDGILADLGVSSHQFDEGQRGFSIRFDGDLDMRMDRRQTLTAHHIVTTYKEEQLHKLFEQYGEVTNSRTLAKTIIQMRQLAPLGSIANFKHAVNAVVKGNPNRWYAQVFQALRIEVNDELGALKEMLQQVPDLLRTGGRVAIISFHSLEDRIVKNFFKKGSISEEDQNPFEKNRGSFQLKVITKKPIIPSSEELKQNPRSRSAKLRIAEKV